MEEERVDFTRVFELIEGQMQALANKARELDIPFLMVFQANWLKVNANLPGGSNPSLIDAAREVGVDTYARTEYFAEKRDQVVSQGVFVGGDQVGYFLDPYDPSKGEGVAVVEDVEVITQSPLRMKYFLRDEGRSLEEFVRYGPELWKR